jgi:hypothetical protein
MVGIVTAALFLAASDAPLKPLTPDEAFEAPPTPPPTAPPAPLPDEAFESAPASRWPGSLAMWVGGSVLTVSTFYGALTATTFCADCDPGTHGGPLQDTAFMVGGGVLAMLAGMMYLAWAQPDEEPWPKSPGFVAATTGLVQIVGGLVRQLMVPGFEPDHSWETRSVGVIVGSGAVALVAGIVWLAWAGTH